MKDKMNTRNTEKKRKENKHGGIIFLASVLIFYLVLFLFEPEKIQESLKISRNIVLQIAPWLLLIIFLMGIINYFVKPKTVLKYVGEGSGIKGWILAISTGILSHGPIYAWYPLLRDLRNQGMKSGLVAVFLYNRSIKIPLLPFMVYYFKIPFVIILTVYIIIASIIQGHIIQKIDR
ncbi:MAG: permease [Thermodesulfobacteriota bacterium]|nr:permease [Thermodesulfobacteriota bacterium]